MRCRLPRSIGADYRDVGDRLRPGQIVEALLFPNKVIAKGDGSFVVLTDDGNFTLNQATAEPTHI